MRTKLVFITKGMSDHERPGVKELETGRKGTPLSWILDGALTPYIGRGPKESLRGSITGFSM